MASTRNAAPRSERMPSAVVSTRNGNGRAKQTQECFEIQLSRDSILLALRLPQFLPKERCKNMNNFGRSLGGALLTLAFVFGISAAMGDTAQAQYRNGQYQRRDRRDNQRAQDSRWRRDRDWDRSNRNRRSDNDSYRNNRVYSNRGYGNYGGYNSQYELNQGYQQGLNTGASDAQRGQSYSPQRSRYYKGDYSQAFRQGFVQGYDQGYRQYAYRNRSRNGGGILGGIFGRR